MCELSYKPQDFNIGFLYNVILDGRIVGCVPETLTEFFINKLRKLKVQGKHVNTIFFPLDLCIFFFLNSFCCITEIIC